MRAVAVVGPTATGKSNLALHLAERLGRCEIVSVDSMQVYRGMDIGTAKPTLADRARVPHHMLDLLDPHEECSVAWFTEQAAAAVTAIRSSGGRALLVGGTGLYHRAVVDGLAIPAEYPEIRAQLEAEDDTPALHDRLRALDPVGAARMEPSNRRRVIRALEVTLGSGRPFSQHGAGLTTYPPSDVVHIGLVVDRTLLSSRIAARLDRQMSEGFVDEVARLDRRAEGWSRTAEQALGYRELRRHLRDGAPLDACLEQIRVRTRRFAARQVRWFRRDPRIAWFDTTAADLVDQVVRHVAKVDRASA